MKTRRFLISILTGLCVCLMGAGMFTACAEEHTHSYTSQTITEATCLGKGVVTYTCSCGDTYTEELPALGHDIKTHEAQAPTCTEKGWNSYETCERESCEYTTYEEIPATDLHNVKDGYCITCKNPESTPGLTYSQNEDGTYTVTGLDSYQATHVVISLYNNRSVTNISEFAFKNCTDLTNVKIGYNVTKISDNAFYNCNSLYKVINHSDLVFTIGSRDNGDVASYAKILVDKNGNTTYKQDIKYIETEEEFLFQKQNTTYTLIAYVGEKEIVTLPSHIYGNTYTIYRMRGVRNVIIPNGITSIGDYAFYGCHSLTSVIISDSVTSIGSKTFSDCSSLTSVIIPDSVTTIGDWAFYWCTSLTNIKVDENSANYQDIDGNLYTKDGTTLIQYAVGKTATSFSIPNGVTSIGDNAFYKCSNLTSIVIPDSVTSIGENAFYNCSSLTNVEIGNSVTTIDFSAFSNCSSLTNLVISDSVTSIGEESFFNCTSLVNVYYKGTASDWSNISIDLYNSQLTDARRYYYSETKPTASGNYWHYVDGTPTKW